MNPDHPPHEDLRSCRPIGLPGSDLQGDRAAAAVRRREGASRRGFPPHRPRASRDARRDRHPRAATTRRRSRERSSRSTARSIRPSLVYTGEVEDFFFLIEAELRRRLGPDLAGRLHTGRSRNDIDHTLFKLALKSRIDDLAARAARSRGDAHRRRRPRARYADRRLHARPAGAARHVRPLPRGHRRIRAARPRAARRGAAHRRSLADGRRRDHHLRLPARPPADGAAPRLRRAAGKFLRLHRVGRLRYGHLRRRRAPLPASRPSDPGPAVLDELRGRPGLCAERVRADQLDHAAEAQSGADRAPAPSGVPDGRPRPGHARHRPQHAVHRHERQRGRDAGNGLRRLRVRRARARSPDGPPAGPAHRRPGASPRTSAGAASR